MLLAACITTSFSKRFFFLLENYNAYADWYIIQVCRLPKKTRKTKAALMIYTTWNIWKERNRRVFEHKAGSPTDVLHDIKAEINERRMDGLWQAGVTI